VSEHSRAVFLSYASQDAEAARRICEALRGAGIEVWFDQSELRGGDVWDQKIRQQIRDCALFVPIISKNTASRGEGYFRLEWGLADQRSHMMARNRTFIVPVCVDTTPDAGADVPESFLRVQWTRLPGGTTPPASVEWIATLLGAAVVKVQAPAERTMRVSIGPPSQVAPASRRTRLIGAGLLVAVLTAALVAWQPWRMFTGTPTARAPAQAGTATSGAEKIHRRPAIRRHEREARSGVLLRRPGRGADRRSDPGSELTRPGAHLLVLVQGQGNHDRGDRAHARRHTRARGERAKVGRPHCASRASLRLRRNPIQGVNVWVRDGSPRLLRAITKRPRSFSAVFGVPKTY